MAALISWVARAGRLLLWCMFTCVLAIAAEEKPIVPVWRVDLRGALGSSPVPASFGHIGEYKGEPVTSLWFTDDDTIVATFVTHGDERPSLSARGSDDDLSLRLRGLFVEATSGKIKANSSWGSESTLAKIVVAHAGKFITQSGSELILYGQDLEVLGKLTLPRPQEYEWLGYPSPTGENILFRSPPIVERTEPVSWMWLATPTLQTRQSLKAPSEFHLAVADDQIARVDCAFPPHKCLPRVEVKDLAGEWRVIATGPEYYNPQFINDDLLGIWGGNLLTVMGLDGAGVFTRNLKGAGRIVTSAGGERFVVPIFTVKGHIAALDIDGHSLLKQLLLYDIPSYSWSYTLDIKAPNIKDKMDFALSPDGLRLAVLNDEILYLFALPPLQSAQSDTPNVQ